jgi:hypothetical protein
MLTDLQRQAIRCAALVARAELAKRAKAAAEARAKVRAACRCILPPFDARAASPVQQHTERKAFP